MDTTPTVSRYPEPVQELLSTAVGRLHRSEPVRGRSGGPAGNARLTSWTGLVLLVLLAVEGVTILSLGKLLGVHLFVGALLVPPVLLKSATTGWRILRYYTGDRDYVVAGPPPLLLRLLGPAVIVTSLAVFATGLGLVIAGEAGLGRLAQLHKLSFILWFAAMALHVLARTVPALRIASGRDLGSGSKPVAETVPGAVSRASALAVSLIVGLVLAVIVSDAASWWTTSWQQR